LSRRRITAAGIGIQGHRDSSKPGGRLSRWAGSVPGGLEVSQGAFGPSEKAGRQAARVVEHVQGAFRALTECQTLTQGPPWYRVMEAGMSWPFCGISLGVFHQSSVGVCPGRFVS